jgi:tRNA 2-thiouridine synthesizing protein A
VIALPDPDEPDAEVRPGLTIDALGTKCPIPVIMLAERIREVRTGDAVEVLSDDPAARADLPDWCRLMSHELLRMEERPGGWAFLIRRVH